MTKPPPSPYTQKLRDPRWHRKLNAILERDSYTCLACGSSEKPLSVFHTLYHRLEPWEYPDYLYQTLCFECRATRTELIDNLVDALRISLCSLSTSALKQRLLVARTDAMEVVGCYKIDPERDTAA